MPWRYKQKMTSKTRHKSLADENKGFGSRGGSLGKAEYKTQDEKRNGRMQ